MHMQLAVDRKCIGHQQELEMLCVFSVMHAL